MYGGSCNSSRSDIVKCMLCGENVCRDGGGGVGGEGGGGDGGGGGGQEKNNHIHY